MTKRVSVKQELAQHNIDALLVTRPENLRYLTGFTGGPDGACLVTGERLVLLTDFRYQEQARVQSPSCELIIVTEGYAAALHDISKKHGLRRIGYEGDVMTCSQFAAYQKKLNFCTFVSVSGLIEKKRLIKQPFEIERIQKASAISQLAFSEILELLKPGVQERDIALELDYRMRKHGAEKSSFDTIVVAGKNSSLVHGEPGGYCFQNGDFILMDFGCVYEGYCSDMTRTVALGKVSQRQREVYQIVLDAQRAALEALVPGRELREIDKVARDRIAEAGFGDCFGHSLGHGVGLEIHEQPTLSPKSVGALREGMVVTVEPGIYLEQEFGVRIEDLVVIGQDSAENLCKGTKKELIAL